MNIRTSSQSGVALVVVLSFLVLVSAVTVAFLSSSQTEMQSARTYESSITVKQLVSSANNVVLGQIADATRSTVPAEEGGSEIRQTWASQPGMIRTWDDKGNLTRYYKLYSARDMVLDGNSGFIPSKEAGPGGQEVPEDWPSKTALFTDLNSPVLVADETGSIVREGRKYRAAYPILDPLALNQVEGFNIQNPPGYGGSLAEGQPQISADYDPTVPPGADKTANPAPMPVAWIYVLKDGTLTVPTGIADDGRTATWDSAPDAVKPSRKNPITGRIAFWTEDETSKLNVNTSSEPTPWDTPRAISIQDLKYGLYQPAKYEYQRFPGHPFTTALSPVLFPQRLPGRPVGPDLTSQQKEAIYLLAPRIEPGGSRAGTVGSLSSSGLSQVRLDGDRLFANVDEFIFQPATRGLITDNPSLRLLNLDINRMRRSRFFLTANSRAPEVNLWGKPRISLWPVHQAPNGRTVTDRLAAFCGTLGSGSTAKQYYFQRRDPNSPTADYMTILRNQQLYRWLQAITSENVPGFGGNFEKKWGPDRDQVLTQIFDYIRCTNLSDPQAGATKYTTNGQVSPIQIGQTMGFGRIHSISQFGLHFICRQDGPNGLSTLSGSGQSALPAGTKEIEAAFLFEPYSPSLGWYKLLENLYYQVDFVSPFSINGQPLTFSGAGVGMSDRINDGWHNNGRERGGSGGLRGPMQAFGGGNYRFVSNRIRVTGDSMSFTGGRVRVRVYAGSSANPAALIQTFEVNFPDGSFPAPRLVAQGTTPHRGGDTPTTAAFWWQFKSANFGGQTVGRYSRLGDVPHVPGPEYRSSARRWSTSGGQTGFKVGGVFREEDVVRTIVPSHGDIRLIAAKKNVGPEFTAVSPHWSSNYRHLHVFSASSGTHFHFGFCNEPGPQPSTNPDAIPPADLADQLVWQSPSSGGPPPQYHYSRLPEIGPGAAREINPVTGYPNQNWGDFDNGVAQWQDGAYINKPDEGNTASTNAPYAYWAWNYTDPTEVNFSPNRLIPSAGMLGSLPTGVLRGRPWETLLFRPQPDHPGQDPKQPKDHLIMDLFWMPVIEPYAISEPFSTAGKINMNYEIAPFTYIRRATALHGAFKAEEPLLIKNEASKIYKLWDHETNDNPLLPSDSRNQDPQVRADWDRAFRGQKPFDRMRRPIDPDETLAQFEERFASGEIFRSASQICEMHLVRDDENLSDYRSGKIWKDHLITGDNTRERPYANLYAKLTTKSNSFTVHVRVQSLHKAISQNEDAWAVWREDKDQVLGEFRGSSLIERYVDPADPELPDFADTNNVAATLDKFYRFRTVATKKFTP